MRRLLHRLRVAWRVLIGRVDPDALEKAGLAMNEHLTVASVSYKPVRLHAEWWSHGPDVRHALGLVKRELMERAGEQILYTQEDDACGGYRISGDLYLYHPSQEALP